MLCCDIPLPVEIFDQAFDAADEAFSATCETGPYGYRSNATVSLSELLLLLQLTIPLSLCVAPCETQKKPDHLKNGYYKGPESNRPERQRRSPPKRA